MPAIEVVRLHRDRAKAAAAVHARAFYHDPLFTCLLPDEATRMPPLLWLMRGCVSFGRLYGQVYTTPNLESVAVCLTPQSPPANRWRLMRAGLAFAPLTSGRKRHDLLAGEIRRMGRIHSLDAPEPHWYVWFLGVEPSVQGHGFGTAVLQSVLERADDEGRPCRLDTVNEVNVPFYERRGFEVFTEGEVAEGGPHYWRMRREPRP